MRKTGPAISQTWTLIHRIQTEKKNLKKSPSKAKESAVSR